MTSPIKTFDFGNCTYLCAYNTYSPTFYIVADLVNSITKIYMKCLCETTNVAGVLFMNKTKRAKKRRSTEGPTHCAACTHEKSRVPSCATSAVWDLQSQRFGFRIFAASMKLAPQKICFK